MQGNETSRRKDDIFILLGTWSKLWRHTIAFWLADQRELISVASKSRRSFLCPTYCFMRASECMLGVLCLLGYIVQTLTYCSALRFLHAEFLWLQNASAIDRVPFRAHRQCVFAPTTTKCQCRKINTIEQIKRVNVFIFWLNRLYRQ